MPAINIDIEVNLCVVIKNAVSRTELEKHYGGDLVRCARELLETGGLTGTVQDRYRVTAARELSVRRRTSSKPRANKARKAKSVNRSGRS